MQYIDYTTELCSSRTHRDYVEQSDRYRTIHQAPARTHTGRSSYRLVERLGARLIALGRTLCERRGALAVEVAFRPGAGAGRKHGHSRHVA